MLVSDFHTQVASDDSHNPEPSVDRPSEKFDAESDHHEMAQVSSSSSKSVPGEAVGISEVVDLTCADSPDFCASVESSKDKVLESKPKKSKKEVESSKKSSSFTKISQSIGSSLPSTIGDKGIAVFASQPKTCPYHRAVCRVGASHSPVKTCRRQGFIWGGS